MNCNLNQFVLAEEEIHNSRSFHQKQFQKQKCPTVQLATTEGLTIQEDPEQFQHEDEVYGAQDTISIDPAPATAKPRV